jgi:hypothetical protein
MNNNVHGELLELGGMYSGAGDTTVLMRGILCSSTPGSRYLRTRLNVDSTPERTAVKTFSNKCKDSGPGKHRFSYRGSGSQCVLD